MVANMHRLSSVIGIAGGVASAAASAAGIYGTTEFFCALSRSRELAILLVLGAGSAITMGIASCVTFIVSLFAVRDALSRRTGGPAGRLWLVYGFVAILGAGSLFDGVSGANIVAMLACLFIAATNFTAWLLYRRVGTQSNNVL